MSPLCTLPLSTLSVLNDLIIRVVEVDGDKADSTPIPMFVDAYGTVAGLKEQIYRSFTSDNVVEPHKIRLICTNTNGGSAYVSASFLLEARLAGYASVSNDAKLKSFLSSPHNKSTYTLSSMSKRHHPYCGTTSKGYSARAGLHQRGGTPTPTCTFTDQVHPSLLQKVVPKSWNVSRNERAVVTNGVCTAQATLEHLEQQLSLANSFRAARLGQLHRLFAGDCECPVSYVETAGC
ncbi:hypothetical protein BGX27_002620 [Mortierella sp. AM989]|nr:hypothetical protein BGX27_002620 [Mortierella sp. AM989]